MRLHQHLPRRAACFCATTAAVFTFALSVPDAARAQSAQSSQAAKADLLARQRALWSLEEMKRRRSDRGEKRAANRADAYRRLAEDFQELQLRNYDLAGAAQTGVALDYERIRKESSEVRKRAESLRTHLVLPEAGGEEKKVEEVRTAEELRAAIASLDAAVNSFAWNPVFQQPGVLDAEQSVKARRDLERVLALSERIRKCAESLAKGPRQD